MKAQVQRRETSSDMHEQTARRWSPAAARARDLPPGTPQRGSGKSEPKSEGVTWYRPLRQPPPRLIAGIVCHDGISQPPRMHDLRHTFAVHRLTAWHKHGADLNRMVPALSVYMGYVRLGAATRFLRLTPERFRSQLDKAEPSSRQTTLEGRCGTNAIPVRALS